jgi:hypothetical protein
MNKSKDTLEYRSPADLSKLANRQLYMPAVVCLISAFTPELFVILFLVILPGWLHTVSPMLETFLAYGCVWVWPVLCMIITYLIHLRLRRKLMLFHGMWALELAGGISALHVLYLLMALIITGGENK